MVDTEENEFVCDETTTSDAEMVAVSERVLSDDNLKVSTNEHSRSSHGGVVQRKPEPDEEPSNLRDNFHHAEESEQSKSFDVHEAEACDDSETQAGDDKPDVEIDAADYDDDIYDHSHRSVSEDDADVMPCDDEVSHAADHESVSVSVVKSMKSSSRERTVPRRWMLSNSSDRIPKRRLQRLLCKKAPLKVLGHTASTSPRSAASKLSQSAIKPSISGGRCDNATKHDKLPVKDVVISSVRRSSQILASPQLTMKSDARPTIKQKVQVSDHDRTPDTVGKQSNATRQKSTEYRQTSMDNSEHSDDQVSNASFPVTRGSRRKPVADRAVVSLTSNVIYTEPRSSAVGLPDTVDSDAQHQIAAMSPCDSQSNNKRLPVISVDEEALTMRIAVVNQLLEQAAEGRLWEICLCYQKELAELNSVLESARTVSTLSQAMVSLQTALQAAKTSNDWSECQCISLRMQELHSNMSRSESGDAHVSNSQEEDGILLRMASLQKEQNAASDANMFAHCQQLQVEVDSLQQNLEGVKWRSSVPSNRGASHCASNSRQQISDLQEHLHRAKIIGDFDECIRISTAITDLKRSSHFNQSMPNSLSDQSMQQKMFSLKSEQRSALDANDFVKCLAIATELSQLELTMQALDEIEEKRSMMQRTLSALVSTQHRAKEAKDYKECVRVAQQIKKLENDFSSVWSSNAAGKDVAKTARLDQCVEAKGSEKMSIQDILQFAIRLPSRVSVSSVRIAAVGKVMADAFGGAVKGWGKLKGKLGDQVGKSGGSKGKGKGKGKCPVQQVVLHVFDEATGHIITLHWKKPSLSVAGLEKSLANILNATPMRTDKGQVFLELDHRSDVKSLVNSRHGPFDLYSPIASTLTMTINQAGYETIGSNVDIVLRCQHVAMKLKSDGYGSQFLQVDWVDLEGQMMQMPVFDHEERDFQEGDTYIAWGLAIKPSRVRAGGGYWVDDATWGVLRYSGWSTAFVNASIFMVTQTLLT